MRHYLSFIAGVCAWSVPALLLIASAGEPKADDALTAEHRTFFEAKIRPVLIRECYGCHSNQSGTVRGGLRLDTAELTRAGGSSGEAVVPGKPEDSLLFTAMTHESLEMPPKRKLPANVIEDFRKWIAMGAPDPRATTFAEVKSTVTDEDIQRARDVLGVPTGSQYAPANGRTNGMAKDGD